MTRKIFLSKTLLLLTAVLFILSSCSKSEPSPKSQVSSLTSNWKIQSVEKLTGTDEASVSQNGFDVTGWYEGIVPGTVMGALTTFKVIEDPTFGINMKNVDPAQFRKPWWFRTSFNISAEDLDKNVSLRFNGINYRADLWVNGKKVADMNEFAGAYRMFTFNINPYIHEGENTLALKMSQPADGEYSIGFVDWNPLPVDRNMGIYREVFLEINEGVKIRSPFIYAKVDTVSKSAADLFFQAEIVNSTDKPVEGVFSVDFEVGKVEKQINLNANESLSVKLNPEDFAQLKVKNVELWWPNGMGNAKLYNMKAEFTVGNKIFDRVEKKYGIREIRSYMNEDKNRAFEINGKFVLVKGGGWADDIFLRDSRKSVESQMRYIRNMQGYGPNPPDADWPGGARIAVQFVLNYEEGGENNILHGDAASEAFLSEIIGAVPWPGQRHWNMESIYEYGARAGFWRLWRMFTDKKLPITIFGVSTGLLPSPVRPLPNRDPFAPQHLTPPGLVSAQVW